VLVSEPAGAIDVTPYRDRSFAERSRFLGALCDIDGAQHRVLTDLLAAGAGTAFGTAHGFAGLRDLADYRRAVPIRDYRALQPWIDRAAAGEPNVLSADAPLVFFTSSGSTGAAKKIPITARFMRQVYFPFYYQALAAIVQHHPAAIASANGTLNLKHDVPTRPATTASGRPHVGASQVDFGAVFGEPLSAEPGTKASWATLPLPVDDDAHSERTYLRLRQAVEHDVRCVIGVNPAMVAALPHQLAAWWPRIVRDLRDGTFGGRPGGTPNPARAAELERLAESFGTLRPAHVWPRFELIYCWTTGLAKLYLPRVAAQFGAGVSVLPAPVAASEGPLGVPIDRHPTAGAPAVESVLYEYLDADEDIKPDSDTLGVSDLEAGRDYHVLVSHVGGLYRYALGDVLHVVDRRAGVPRVEYAGRNQLSDLVGERLRESHIIRALDTVLRTGGITVANATCRAVTPDGRPPRYEFALAPDRPFDAREVDAVTAALDAALSATAPGYRRARQGAALDPPVLHRTAPDAFYREWQRTVERGVRQTQVKDRVFQRDDDVWQRLVGSS
jgi:hypothetical protein